MSAVKILEKDAIIKSGHDAHVKKGLKALRSAQNSFTVHVSAAFQDHTNLYIITDFVPGTTLYNLIRHLAVSGVYRGLYVHSS